jgi:hypothetical protein
MVHVLGYSTLVADLLVALGVIGWLRVAGRAPYTWQRRLRTPKLAAVSPSSTTESAGFSDHIGFI